MGPLTARATIAYQRSSPPTSVPVGMGTAW